MELKGGVKEGKEMTEQEEVKTDVDELKEEMRVARWEWGTRVLENLDSKVITLLLEVAAMGDKVGEAGALDEVQADILRLMRQANQLGCEGVSIRYDHKRGWVVNEGYWLRVTMQRASEEEDE